MATPLFKGANTMKQIVCIGWIVLCLLLITSCTAYKTHYRAQFVGDDAYAAQSGDTYSYRAKNITLEKNQVSITFRDFYGRETLYRVENVHQEASIMLEIHISVDSSLYRLVLLNLQTHEIITLQQGSGYAQKAISLKMGNYAIKSLGYDVSGEVMLNFTSLNGVSVESSL